MLTIKEAKAIKSGKGIRINNKKYSYRALVVANGDEGILLATQYFARSFPQYANYGKTWYVEEIY